MKNNESYGEGYGILTTRDGATATWKLHGAGQMLPSCGRSLKGSAIYRIASQPAVNGGGTLAQLDNIVVVFEYDIDANGTYHGKAWQWK